ncbi:histone-fold-containing protein [Hyphopichia burtonii NRRL Y-1933]|uniref:Histone-fold-containing protein n=1 Tax=Hyphopichia burtonii NRRL Y-1933 TaxID=984485 RepID=A0A1E4RDA3_9ASCO|nr:histone-fold-containing protein [Hyphopichia burtonii NRRL Y-1933]ODV65237.1 histone-fold-containing protein [Hyphopichia burtonii NRRL Y-1933]
MSDLERQLVDDGYQSDVSLEEEDEELIWRVFYSPLEERARQNEEPSLSDEESDEENDDDVDVDEDLTDLSDIDDPELVAKYRELKQSNITDDLSEEQERRLLLSSFTEEQMEKYEAFRRTTVNKPGVKKIVNSVLGHSIPQNVAVVLAGLSKLLLGELITRAFEVQEREFKAKLIMDIDNKKKQKRKILKSLEEGREIEVDHKPLVYAGDFKQPLKPEHIQEAWRLYKLENSSVFNAQWRRQGEADGRFFR